jgi:hypothetical protein
MFTSLTIVLRVRAASQAYGLASVVLVDMHAGAWGVALCGRRTCTADRKSRSALLRITALSGAHGGSHYYLALRVPIFLSPQSRSHHDASHFFAACLGSALDALCGSTFQLSSADTVSLPHVAFPRGLMVHTMGSTGCHDHNGGR